METTSCNSTCHFSGSCRLIVSDMDFTYLDEDKQVPAENIQAITAARARGIHFAFASGRAWWAVKKFVEPLGLRVPQIVNNGAELVDPLTDQVVDACSMSPEVAQYLYGAFLKRGLPALVFKGSHAIAEEASPSTVHRMIQNSEPIEIVSSQKLQGVLASGVEKMAVVCVERATELDGLDGEVAGEATKYGFRYAHVASERGILVFSALEATKVTGIEKLCRRIGCTMNDVMALGDGDNDAEMLGAVGLGVAMANATPKAKAAACHTTLADCNHAGVAEAIRRFCLSGAPRQ